MEFQPSIEDLEAAGPRQRELHERAWEVTRKQFGGEVFIRGVVEVSNFCRENCYYCGMRRANRDPKRYRLAQEPMVEWLLKHRPDCLTDLNIQTGEDPVVVREVVVPLLRRLRDETDLGLSVCLGTLDQSLYQELFDAGAGMYIMKFETSDAALYRQLQAPGTLDERLDHVRWLAGEGWFVSSGFIVGLPGQNPQTILGELATADSLPLGGCSVSPFIPGESTPLADRPSAPVEQTLNCMAMMRLMRPDWVIPVVSALNLAGEREDYVRGLRVGANLCTINLTPDSFRGDYLLYKRRRFIMTEERILRALEALELAPSAASLASRFWSECRTA